MQRIATGVTHVLLIRAAFKQGLHQGYIARRRSRHQGSLVHRQTMFYPVAGALVQNFLEVLGKIGRVALLALAGALPPEVPRGVHAGVPCQPFSKRGHVMAAGDVKELLARLTAGGAFTENLDQQFGGSGLIEYWPGHWALPEDVTSDSVDLFPLPLEFEFASFPLPVFEAGLLRVHPHLSRGRELKQFE